MQGGKKIVIKNTIFIAGARYINLITTGLLTIFLARYLDIPIFGKYITIFSFLFFANILANFGIPLIIVRNVARNLKLANLYFFNATFIMLCFSLIAYFIINLIAFLMYNDKELKLLILIASISLFPGVISSTCGAIFRAFERMEMPSLINSFISIFSFFVIILILFTVNKKLFFIILTNVLFSFLNMILIFKKLKKNINLKFEKINYSLCFSILKQSFAVAFIRIFNMINQRIDIIMLSTMSGMANVGFYGVPVRLISTLNIPFTSLSVALLPRVSIYFNKARSLKNIYKQSQRFYIFLGLIITIIIFLFSKQIISILFGSKYIEGNAHNALRILILAFLINKISGPAGVVILSMEEKLNKFIPFAFFGAILNIGLNLLWIPRYGILGASLATLICALVISFIKLFLVQGVLRVSS
ncbi:MAG: hypothetical protein DRG20_06805 [Deltaproteobacteria bacterium]|nr:MAG: hypothetical protein DRG20_06805 [Deltaproteobacteria bacterium]